MAEQNSRATAHDFNKETSLKRVAECGFLDCITSAGKCQFKAFDRASSRARVLDDGRIELESYDFSSSANDWFGDDVAWMYRIGAADKPHLIHRDAHP
jgi:hypothetical protein